MKTRLLVVSALLMALTAMQLPASASTTTFVIAGHCQHPQMRPASILFACADGGWYARHLHWTKWGPYRAVGHGVFHINDCNPNCAQGTFHTREGSITLSRRHQCPGMRRWVFGHAAVVYDVPWHGRTMFSTRLFCPLG